MGILNVLNWRIANIPRICWIWGFSHVGDYEECYLLECNTGRSPPTFRRNIAYCFSAWLLVVSCSAYTSTLIMVALHPPEIFVDLRRAARWYIPEDRSSTPQILYTFKYDTGLHWGPKSPSPLWLKCPYPLFRAVKKCSAGRALWDTCNTDCISLLISVENAH